MKKIQFSEVYFYIKIAIIACYFAVGIYILSTENIFSYYSETLKYGAGVIIVCYGLFRAVRLFKEYKNRNNEQEEPD